MNADDEDEPMSPSAELEEFVRALNEYWKNQAVELAKSIKEFREKLEKAALKSDN